MNNIEKVKLPSNGMLEDTPKEVTVRGMLGREISTLYSSLTDAAIDKIIKSVVEPQIDPDTLCDEDKKFILHKTRELTFGDEITVSLRCPVCSNIHEYTIKYSDLEVALLEEEAFLSKIDMKDGSSIQRKVPTKIDWNSIYRYKEKRNLPEDYSFLLLAVARIGLVDGKNKGIGELIDYLENLPGRELTDLAKRLGLPFGLDTGFKVNCKTCDTEFPGGIGINADLFR